LTGIYLKRQTKKIDNVESKNNLALQFYSIFGNKIMKENIKFTLINVDEQKLKGIL